MNFLAYVKFELEDLTAYIMFIAVINIGYEGFYRNMAIDVPAQYLEEEAFK